MAVAPTIDWHSVVPSKWLLWDSSAIIRVIQYKGESIFDELQELDVVNVYIKPVELELLATSNSKESVKRSDLLDQYFDLPIPFTNNEITMASKIQVITGTIGQPSPVDLFLGAVLAKHAHSMLLITENIKDFPAPYFTRECYVNLQDEKTACSLAFLSTEASRFL